MTQSEITDAMLESVWLKVAEYEKEHFGQKCGEDYALIAEVLRRSQKFMGMGLMLSMVASMEVSGMAQEARGKSESEKDLLVKNVIDRPTMVHTLLAEFFYVGYKLGKQVAEVSNLERMDR